MEWEGTSQWAVSLAVVCKMVLTVYPKKGVKWCESKQHLNYLIHPGFWREKMLPKKKQCVDVWNSDHTGLGFQPFAGGGTHWGLSPEVF